MREQIIEFEAGDGYPLRARSWQSGDSETLVVMQHGVLTHSGWFGELGDALLAAGVHAIGHDRRGSGLNDRDRGDVDGPDRLLDDLHAVVEPQRRRYRSIVHFGWCLGSTLALHYLLRRPAMGEGLIMMSPDIFEAHLRPEVRKAFSDPKWDDRERPRLRVPIPAEIYTDTEYLDSFIRPDAMKLKDFTPRFMRATMRLKEDLPEHFAAFDKPSMLVLATRDRIIDNRKTREIYRHIGSASPKVVELDCNHGIQFEALDSLVETTLGFVRSLEVREGVA